MRCRYNEGYVEGADRTMGILIGVSEVVAVAPSGSKAPFGWDPQYGPRC